MSYEIQRALGKIEGLVEGIKEQLDDMERRYDVVIVDHDKRLKSVEKKTWYAAGFSAAVAFLAAKFPGMFPT
jgi:CRISPR/Cas system CSM-associated protein Csm2 small subunit